MWVSLSEPISRPLSWAKTGERHSEEGKYEEENYGPSCKE